MSRYILNPVGGPPRGDFGMGFFCGVCATIALAMFLFLTWVGR